MRMPPEDTSPVTLHKEFGQYHLARLLADGKLKEENLGGVAFVPLTGEYGHKF